jgi:hypothetical protein
MAQDEEGWYSVPAFLRIQVSQSLSDWVEAPGEVSEVKFEERGVVFPRRRASFREVVRIDVSLS